MLHRLVYVSEINAERTPNIGEIMAEASRFNRANDVTGALWFDGQFFIQLLEGDEETLSNIFENRIKKANSHTNVRLSCFEPCNNKLFPDWSMAYLSEKGQSTKIAHKFMNEKGFNPRQCSADDLINLLCFLEDNRQRNAAQAI